MIIPISNKEVKVINDLNQNLKKVFTRYLIFGNGFVIPADSKDTTVDGGIHFSTILPSTLEKIHTIFGNEKPVLLDADKVFKAIKDNKKDLISLSLSDIQISFQGENNYPIGSYLSDLNTLTTERFKTAQQLKNAFTYNKLSVDLVESLCNNEIMVYKEGEYKVRVTKELIPNLKKDMVVLIGFRDDMESSLFQMMISTIKDDITTYHTYRCIRY